MTNQGKLLATVLAPQVLLAAALVTALRFVRDEMPEPPLPISAAFALVIAQLVMAVMWGVLAQSPVAHRTAVAGVATVVWSVLANLAQSGLANGTVMFACVSALAAWILRLSGLRIVFRPGSGAQAGHRFSIVDLLELTTWCGALLGTIRLLPGATLGGNGWDFQAIAWALLMSSVCWTTVWGALGTGKSSWRAAAVIIAWSLAACGVWAMVQPQFDSRLYWIPVMEIFVCVTAALPLCKLGYRLMRPPKHAA